jgi:hypothetical protein
MNGRRAVIGLCMLCALFVSAIAAQGASAKGTTAFTCAPAEGTPVGFSKEHCKRADAVSTGAKFKHVEIANGTTTELSGTNAKTNSETNASENFDISGVIGGIPVTITASTVGLTGVITNSEVGGEMIASLSGTLSLTGMVIDLPAGQGCVVKGGALTTKKLKATTAGEPTPEEETNAGMFLKFEPNEGTVVAEVSIEKCTTTALNGTFNLTGTIKGRPDGATTVFTTSDTETQGTLKLAGQKATLNGKITLSGKKSSDSAFKPLSFTTK